MFYSKGWMPLVQLFSRIEEEVNDRYLELNPEMSRSDRHVEGMEEGGVPTTLVDAWKADPSSFQADIDEETNWQVWMICEYVSSVAVMSPSGEPIMASKLLLECFNTPWLDGTHVNLSFGTVGSTGFLGNKDTPPSSGQLAISYGPFLGCPILLKVDEVEKAIQVVRSFSPFFPRDQEKIKRKHGEVGNKTQSRGRPRIGGGIREETIRSEFIMRKEAGQLSPKKEATIQESIEWAKAAHNWDLTRTSAQRYLAPIWEDSSAR